MEISLGIRAGLFVLFAAAFLIGLYLQLKHFQRSRDEQIDARLEKEELYNSIVTSRAIADSLRNQGCDVADSEYLAEMALLAYEKRDYARASEMVKKAREQMFQARNAKEESPFSVRMDASDADEPVIPRAKVSEKVMQTRFLITRAKAVGGEGVEENVAAAESALERGDEDEALAWANRARRAAEGAEEPVEDEGVDDLTTCPECGGEVPPEYRFCGTCGHKVR